MSGKFFAVGVGPGDPELLTIKAINTIKNSDIIVIPKSESNNSVALNIAKGYIENKEILEIFMPMVKDKDVLEHHHNEGSLIIGKLLDENKTVSFLTLGDPTIYSTVMYIHKKLTKKGYDTGIVSGVPSFCGVSASLNTSLCERDEALHIIPATYINVENALKLDGCKILMKSGKTIEKFKNKLKNKNAKIVECATMKNQKIYDCDKNIDEKLGYFSIIVVPSSKND